MTLPYVCQELDTATGQCLQWIELSDGVMSSVPIDIIQTMFFTGFAAVVVTWFGGFCLGIGLKLIRMM